MRIAAQTTLHYGQAAAQHGDSGSLARGTQGSLRTFWSLRALAKALVFDRASGCRHLAAAARALAVKRTAFCSRQHDAGMRYICVVRCACMPEDACQMLWYPTASRTGPACATPPRLSYALGVALMWRH